jgi:hypothetical protein
MIVITTCATASELPHAGAPLRVDCNDRGCISGAAPSSSLVAAPRRVRVSRRG